MKAYSGIIIPDNSRREGSVTIDFDDFSENADVGHGILKQVVKVGGTGDFRRTPAFVVGFRDFVLSDKARGNNEKDRWVLDTRVSGQRMVVNWNVRDSGARVREISFMAVGE